MRRMERSRRRKWKNWYVVRPIKIVDTRLTAFVHRDTEQDTDTFVEFYSKILFYPKILNEWQPTGGGKLAISNTMPVTRTGSKKSSVPSLSLRLVGRHSQSHCRPYLHAEMRDKHTGSSLKQRQRIICLARIWNICVLCFTTCRVRTW